MQSVLVSKCHTKEGSLWINTEVGMCGESPGVKSQV